MISDLDFIGKTRTSTTRPPRKAFPSNRDQFSTHASSTQERSFMIVMKFGGASLASPASIKRVAAIVLSEVHKASADYRARQEQSACQPVVVVSAIGDATDHLLEVLQCASRAQSYRAWKLQEQLKANHFCLAEDLLSTERLESISQYIQVTFRDLHVRMLELCEGECCDTPELRDWVASIGEKLSSRIVAAVFEENCIQTKHMESEQLILTDDHFTNAAPRYWETYARIRWSIPRAARSHVVVLGGFIGATEDGRLTTLGRGGSDLTASILGAAVNADEIQVWKDVDGMLTWNPRIRNGGHRVRSLSYEEASELARAGATILHPEAIAPARQRRIPVVIRNTFRPNGEGTRIDVPRTVCSNPVKSIAGKTNVTVVELRIPTVEGSLQEWASRIERLSREQKAATFLAASDEVIYLSLEEQRDTSQFDFAPDHCMQAHVRNGQAIITLVGETLKARNTVVERLSAVCARRSALILPQNGESCSVQIVVPKEHFAACTDILQDMFFTELDPAFFAPVEMTPIEEEPEPNSKTFVPEKQQVFLQSTSRFAFLGGRR
jgi:aspartate kinase